MGTNNKYKITEQQAQRFFKQTEDA